MKFDPITRISTRKLGPFAWQAKYLIGTGVWATADGWTRRHAIRRLRREMAR